MLFDQLLLRTRLLELMGPDLQRHLLAILLLWGIVRHLRGATIHHVVYEALDAPA
jgi:hypothetical protein